MISTKDVSRLDYLRNRRFLVVEVWSRPAAHARTERKGWHTKSGAMVTVDRPRIVNHIGHNTMRHATVIIDILNDKVIKNRYKTDGIAFDDEILASYKKKYAEAFAN